MVAPDPLHLIIALGPLAVYFLPLGLINLSRRPFLTTGARDTAALGIGISGLIFAGPMELFMPESAAARFHGIVWFLLVAFYGLCLTLFVLLMRPRLVIYNVRIDQLRSILASVVSELDREVRWAGDSLVLPNLCVQLHLDQSAWLRNAQLVATGPSPGWQSQDVYVGWRKLELALRVALRDVRGTRNPHGATLVLTALTGLGWIAFLLLRHPQEVTQSLWEMLRM